MSDSESTNETIIYDQVLRSNNIAFIVLDKQGIVVAASPNIQRKIGLNAIKILQTVFTDLPINLLDAKRNITALADHELSILIQGDYQQNMQDITFVSSEGRYNSQHLEIYKCEYDKNKKTVILFFDAIEEQKYKSTLGLYRELFLNTSEAVSITNDTPEIIDVNPAFSKITGYSREEIIGKNPNVLSSGAHNKEFYQTFWRSLKNDNRWSGQIVNRKKSGELFTEQVTITGVDSDQIGSKNYIAIFSEISRAVDLTLEEEKAVNLDFLTALPSRTILIDRLEQSLNYAERHNLHVAVLYLDIDNLTHINKQEGDKAGDEIIKILAKRLKSSIRHADSIARFGGDDFVIVLRDLEPQFDIQEFVERLLVKIIEPMPILGKDISITCSIGVASYPDSDVNAEKLVRNAGHAMNMAKTDGQAQCIFFSQEKEEKKKKSYVAKSNLVSAVDNNELVLYAQPQFDVNNKSIFGIEILVRWQSPTLGLVLPDEFLNIVKDPSALEKLDRWVVDQTLMNLEEGILDGLSNLIRIGVNLTPASLQSDSFRDWLSTRLSASSPALISRLDFEILESDALDNIDKVTRLIEEVSKYGIKFSLDDFGTGYSSLSVFNLLPVKSVKIDRSFINTLLTDEKTRSLVQAVCEISKVYSRDLIAEGVETKQQADLLELSGCHVMQGYGIAKPMPINIFLQWAKALDIHNPWES
ncbi:EAL domain-containing protein [Reinekea sp.]|jgi:diguanylate cyclase (GGDEF)-like protein/PAS domain S-box-containing protein|uniref:EAL domain-containing protein n=1 Tax=Reinekea sp. TaxID=1970455 RepID=UPI0039898B70